MRRLRPPGEGAAPPRIDTATTVNQPAQPTDDLPPLLTKVEVGRNRTLSDLARRPSGRISWH
jgi:hypothetical protein